MERDAARDLFDSHQLLTQWKLDSNKLRLAFTVYAGMRKNSWRKFNAESIKFDVSDIRRKLIPVLRQGIIQGYNFYELKAWADKLVQESKAAFENLLPFSKSEQEFLNCIEEHGMINPELISSDPGFCAVVKNHPALLWQIKAKATIQ